MLITVAIPTLNRPALLLEAARSVAEQSYRNWEVVVVDDGSQPPADRTALRSVLGQRLKLIRHERPQGIPNAKNAGIQAAAGEIILHLDDDDLLAANALQSIADAYQQYPELDCVFLNVEPFGPFAAGSAENQSKALAKLIERVSHTREGDLVFLGEGLFDALLRSVPLALQRPAARRGAWNMVGGYTTGLLFSEPEWSIRASLSCRVALLTTPASRWRCEGQNHYSRPEFRLRASENAVEAAKGLRARMRRVHLMQKRHLGKVQGHLADAYFEHAYVLASAGRPEAWLPLWRSFVLAPAWRHASLALRCAQSVVWRGAGKRQEERHGA